MFKVIVLSITTLLLVGCVSKEVKNETTHKAKIKMFQTVEKKDATLVQEGKNKIHCVNCGMNLVMFYKTSHVASTEDKTNQYCSIHCLADHLNEGYEFKNPKVVDVTSLKLISVLDAYYVVGSSVRGTMSRTSKYAFKSLKDAEDFQKKYGGKILDFNAALEITQKDFR